MISGFLARFGIGRAPRGTLSVVTRATVHGNLRMEIAYACADLDEPVMLEIVVRKPKRIFVVCDSLEGWTTDGAVVGGLSRRRTWIGPGKSELRCCGTRLRRRRRPRPIWLILAKGTGTGSRSAK